MKHVVFAWITLAAALAVSCSVNHRSGDFACITSAECGGGRVCSDGFCVSGDRPPDARGDACPATCTSCDLATRQCTIDCAVNPGTCNQQVVCPVGWSCNILCSTQGSCRSGINCASAKDCTIKCSGQQACRNVTCGAGACNLECSGRQSCSALLCGTGACSVDCSGRESCVGVSCGLACACDVQCVAGLSCSQVTCKAGCASQPLGCSSKPLGCNTCR